MHARRSSVPLLLAVALPACGCRPESTPPDPAHELHLLARRPDAIVEQPAAIAPQGDLGGMVTWGASEGPGWSQTEKRTKEGAPYRETNQASASLLLPATDPVAREIVLALWCASAVGAEPAHVDVRLNGVALAKYGLTLGREPAIVTVHSPKEAWRRGMNELALSVPLVAQEKAHTWDTLALAQVAYGPEAKVVLDLENERARLADQTGVAYALELASDARVSIAGHAGGPGELRVRIGTIDPRNGASAEPSAPQVFRVAGEQLEGELDLARTEGQVRTLELEWHGSGELELTRLAVLEARPRPRPPIVFVSIDTFAARHLSLYGYGRGTSPELAKLAQDAVVFERCLANAPWTLPSYLSVMSGLYPRAHWVPLEFQAGADISPFDQWQLADNRWTLAEALRARGYRTGGFVDTQWLSPIFRVNQGFDTYNGDGALALFSDPTKHVQHIVSDLIPRWLAQQRTGVPPFLFVHALDAHGPYLPDPPFRDTFLKTLPEARTRVPAGSDNQTYRTMPWWMSRTLNPDETMPESPTVPLEDVIARYDEGVLKVDAYLGKLFDELRERGLYEDAVIVVTGDHGESFGPNYGHGLMREDVLHVPLLLKLPGNAHAGTRVKSPVALVDVYPTLLELAGVPADPARLHGTSLLARIGREMPPEERPLFSEGGHVEQYAVTLGRWRLVEERPGSESSEQSLLTHPRVSDAWLRANAPELLDQPLTKELLAKLLARPGFAERLKALRAELSAPVWSLFDVEADPGELHDLAAERPEIVAELQARLEAERQRSLISRADADPVPVLTPLSPETLEELRDLGYGGGDDKAPPAPKGKKPATEPKK